MVVGAATLRSIERASFRRKIASLAASERAMYSASMVERATMVCL